jgi:hypothetical protein
MEFGLLDLDPEDIGTLVARRRSGHEISLTARMKYHYESGRHMAECVIQHIIEHEIDATAVDVSGIASVMKTDTRVSHFFIYLFSEGKN